jgi:hypothetical protein
MLEHQIKVITIFFKSVVHGCSALLYRVSITHALHPVVSLAGAFLPLFYPFITVGQSAATMYHHGMICGCTLVRRVKCSGYAAMPLIGESWHMCVPLYLSTKLCLSASLGSAIYLFIFTFFLYIRTEG